MSASTHLQPHTIASSHVREGAGEEQIVRFETHQRVQHFLMMSTFIALALTGLPQRFSELGASQWWVSTLGGLETVRTIHRAAGVIMLVDSVYHVGYLFVRIGVQRRFGAFQMIPTPKDAKDAFHMGRFFLGLEAEKPRFGRFSYLEKFDYWAVFWGIAVIGTSGVLLMFAVFTTKLLPGQVIPLATIVHGDEAVLAVGWIAIGHMFNAHLAPWVFPFNPAIFTGKLSRERYAEDHPLEYERLVAPRPPLVVAAPELSVPADPPELPAETVLAASMHVAEPLVGPLPVVAEPDAPALALVPELLAETVLADTLDAAEPFVGPLPVVSHTELRPVADPPELSAETLLAASMDAAEPLVGPRPVVSHQEPHTPEQPDETVLAASMDVLAALAPQVIAEPEPDALADSPEFPAETLLAATVDVADAVASLVVGEPELRVLALVPELSAETERPASMGVADASVRRFMVVRETEWPALALVPALPAETVCAAVVKVADAVTCPPGERSGTAGATGIGGLTDET